MVKTVGYTFQQGKGYIEVEKQGKSGRFKVIDDFGAGKDLTTDILKKAITQSIDSKHFTLSGRTKTEVVTVDGVKIKLRMSYMSPLLRQIVTFFRQNIIEPLFGKKSELTKHITREFRAVVAKMPERIQKKLLDDVRITPGEHFALSYFGPKIQHWRPEEKKAEFLAKVLAGAYVQIEDGGDFYDQWVKEVPLKEERISSHASCDKQYSFQGPLFKECLFSVKEVDGKKLTWFQLERYPTERIYALPHIFTWVLYKVTGENQGPHGSSPHTEKMNPITLELTSSSTLSQK